METNTVIIGSGISGMTAALYLKRANISCIVIEQSSPGGQILRTSVIENYPSIVSIDGPQFAINIYKQMLNLGIEYLYTTVDSIENKDDLKIVKTSKGNVICKNIIIATGRSPKLLDIDNEKELTSKGISYCAICDGNLYKNKEVAIVGAGNSAFEEAIYLSKLCKSVTMIARSSKYRADKKLVSIVENIDNIKILVNKSVVKINGKEKLESIIYKDNISLKEEKLDLDGLFIYIGQTPNTSNFKNLDILDKYGYIKVNKDMETKIKNIFAVGDCIKKSTYQIITAASDGAIASSIISKQN